MYGDDNADELGGASHLRKNVPELPDHTFGR
jgi:hypothetical protein